MTNTNPIPVTGTVGVTGTVTNADNPARNAVQQSTTISLAVGAVTGKASIMIPANKIFVLEFASFRATTPSGTVVSLEISVSGPQIDGTNGAGLYELVVPPLLPLVSPWAVRYCVCTRHQERESSSHLG